MGIQFATERVFKIQKAEQRHTICPILHEGSQPVGSRTDRQIPAQSVWVTVTLTTGASGGAGHGEDLAPSSLCVIRALASSRVSNGRSEQGFVASRSGGRGMVASSGFLCKCIHAEEPRSRTRDDIKHILPGGRGGSSVRNTLATQHKGQSVSSRAPLPPPHIRTRAPAVPGLGRQAGASLEPTHWTQVCQNQRAPGSVSIPASESKVGSS